MVTVEIVQALFNQKFATASVADIEFAIARAERRCAAIAWDDSRDIGMLLYIAHLLECERQQIIVTSGAATALSEGESGTLVVSGEFLDRTAHGQEFAQIEGLRGLVTVTGFLV